MSFNTLTNQPDRYKIALDATNRIRLLGGLAALEVAPLQQPAQVTNEALENLQLQQQ